MLAHGFAFQKPHFCTILSVSFYAVLVRQKKETTATRLKESHYPTTSAPFSVRIQYVTRFLLYCKSTYPDIGAKKAKNGVLGAVIVLSSCSANTQKGKPPTALRIWNSSAAWKAPTVQDKTITLTITAALFPNSEAVASFFFQTK